MNWCFWSVVLEKTLESPLDCKGIQPVHPRGDQSWVFIGRTHAKAETPIFCPPHVKSWLIGKDPDAERVRGRRRRGRQRMRWLDASLTQWTWVWVNSGSWWWTGRPGVLRFMGWQSQTRLSDWTELNWLIMALKISRFQLLETVNITLYLKKDFAMWLSQGSGDKEVILDYLGGVLIRGRQSKIWHRRQQCDHWSKMPYGWL